MRTGPLEAGELVLLIDRHGRRYLTTLQAGRVQDLRGKIAHDELIGQEEGVVVRNSRGEDFMAVRPTLADYVLLMPRVTTPVYPKDLGQILIAADIFPGGPGGGGGDRHGGPHHGSPAGRGAHGPGLHL
jgi:tRNA (adenine57-N1/adenine58-N1)-methyltransferase